MNTNHKNSFRQDINGLRAIAVISVIIFHFSPSTLPGGFVGVDIFFVISGYLMTSIIFRGFENNNFSFWKFIINRAKRIAPALLVVISILIIIGYFTLDPENYRILARHSRDSLGFISNITYNNESGYFDTESKTKFLLHTWSLSVEWQFYFIYPLVLLLAKKALSKEQLKFLIIILLIFSLVASIQITKHNPDTAYFMFYTRAWEMLFGGIAFLFPIKSLSNNQRNSLEIVGLIIIVYAIFSINTNTPWPGYMATIPVIGTYLCILANNKNTLLSGYIFNKIGLWSYSIYLVHWPIIVLTYTLGLPLTFVTYISITIIISIVLYELIEKRRNYHYGLLIAYIIILLCAVTIRETNGLEDRFPKVPEEVKENIHTGSVIWDPGKWLLFNVTDNNKDLDYILYGDSFSSHYRAFFQTQEKPLANLYSAACLSTPNYYSNNNEECENLYSMLKKNIGQSNSAILVIIHSWRGPLLSIIQRSDKKILHPTTDDLISILNTELEIIKKDLNVDKIVLVGENVFFKGKLSATYPYECISARYIKTIYNRYLGNGDLCDDIVLKSSFDSILAFNNALKNLAATKDWLFYVDPNEALCENDRCTQIENGFSLFADYAHLSIVGAKKVGPYLFEKLDEVQKSTISKKKIPKD